jgi:hypothetical protein
MRTEAEILRDTVVILHVTCACDRVRCIVCAQRREIAEYLEIADGASKRRPLEIVT